MTIIPDNIDRVRESIASACARAGRDPDSVTLVAVSKKKPQDHILKAIDAGVQHFGENRVEEAEAKIPAINQQATTRPVWHMIGHIQSRKAKTVAPLFDVVHSVDRLKIARKLSELAVEADRVIDVLLEVNISGEDAKYGFDVHHWQTDTKQRDAFWRDFEYMSQLPNLSIRGLMTMAPYVDEMEQTRPVFAGLAHLRETLRQHFETPLPDLSMGMTNDYPVAIEEGATIVRIGRAIFGERT